MNSFVGTQGIKYTYFYFEIQPLNDGLHITNFNFKTRKLIMFFCLFLVSTGYTKDKTVLLLFNFIVISKKVLINSPYWYLI